MSRSRGASASTGAPSMRISPADAVSSPATMRSKVVLPQPDGPSSTQNSPSAAAKEMSLRISFAPKLFETLSIVSEAMASSRYSTFHRARGKPLRDAALKDQRQRHQRQRRDRRGRGDLAPGHGVLAGKKRDPHRQGLARRVGENDQREKKLVPGLDENQNRRGENSRRPAAAPPAVAPASGCSRRSARPPRCRRAAREKKSRAPTRRRAATTRCRRRQCPGRC